MVNNTQSLKDKTFVPLNEPNCVLIKTPRLTNQNISDNCKFSASSVASILFPSSIQPFDTKKLTRSELNLFQLKEIYNFNGAKVKTHSKMTYSH